MSDEKHKCPGCDGRGWFIMKHSVINGRCDKCKGTGFVSMSVAESPEADRGPRNASDRASFSVGPVALERYLAGRLCEARREKAYYESQGMHFEQTFYAGAVAALADALKAIAETAALGPAENVSNSPTSAGSTKL